MEVCTVKGWRNCLWILPMLEKNEEDCFKQLTLKIKDINPDLKLDTIFWQPDKKRAKAKEYVRLTNELNETDFNWFGSFKNEDIKNYLNEKYDAFIIFPSTFPKKVSKLLNQVNADLIIGFSQGELALNVVLTAHEQNFKKKTELFDRYILKNK